MNPDDLPPQPPKRKLRFLPKPRARRIPRTLAEDVARAAGLAALHQNLSQKISDDGTPGGSGNLTEETKKDNTGPWVNARNPPITVPFKRPSSNDPENQTTEPNESYATHATKLRLNEINENSKFIVIRFPARFPFPKQQPDTSERSVPITKTGPSVKGKEKVTSTLVSGKGSVSAVSPPQKKATEPSLPLPPPHAKLLVYKSEKIELKIGEIVFDVGTYSDAIAEDIVTINTEDKEFCELGIIENRMVLSIDYSLLWGGGNS